MPLKNHVIIDYIIHIVASITVRYYVTTLVTVVVDHKKELAVPRRKNPGPVSELLYITGTVIQR